MKIAILGGGGFRVPLVYGALLARAERLGLEHVSLYDVDALRLAQIEPVLEGLEQERGSQLRFTATTDLDDALDGSDFVFCAIRVGNLEGRVVDERVPLDEGVVGQETTGPGGLCFALRTVPVMVELARRVAERAPQAWFVNFTNPAGLVTEAIREELGDRAIGICDSPAGLCRRVAAALDRDPEELWFDYFGLNHLGWLRSVNDGTRDLLPELLARRRPPRDIRGGTSLRRRVAPRAGDDPERVPLLLLLRLRHGRRAALRARVARRVSCCISRRAFYGENGRSPEERARRVAAHAARARGDVLRRGARGRRDVAATESWEDVGGYEGEALAVVEAIALNERRVQILNTANRSSLPFLDADAVVEVPCVVGSTGARPIAVGDVPGHARALIESVKEVERLTIQAALTRSRELALKALALHPLVPSVNVARRILDALLGPPGRARGAFLMTIRRRLHRARLPRPDVRGARDAARAGPRALRARAARDARRRGRSRRSGSRGSGSRVAVAAPLGRDVAGRPCCAAARGGGRHAAPARRRSARRSPPCCRSTASGRS